MSNRRISEITRREIASLFCEGYIDTSLFWPESKYISPEDAKIFYPYYGRLQEIEFLKKIYPLDKIYSTDSRFVNAEEDIYQHTINNDDWEYGWVFSDLRFGLIDGDDSILLNFLCAVFHPANRIEDSQWGKYLNKVQDLLHHDGYELYVSSFISNRGVYNWRELTDVERTSSIFIPFSQRSNIQPPRINMAKRRSLVDLMRRMEETEYLKTETGWNYNISTCGAVVDDLKHYYLPKAYNEQEQYEEESNFDKLILRSSPKCVFDIIELYSKYKDNCFTSAVNTILKEIGVQLLDGKIMSIELPVQIEIPREPDLRDLILTAERHRQKHDAENTQIALEKIWDAFERLKTHYSTDKKSSIQAIINTIAPISSDLHQQIDEEFQTLTKIGNTYKIRHFENGKLDITDDRIKEYLYMRCLAILNLVIKYI